MKTLQQPISCFCKNLSVLQNVVAKHKLNACKSYAKSTKKIICVARSRHLNGSLHTANVFCKLKATSNITNKQPVLESYGLFWRPPHSYMQLLDSSNQCLRKPACSFNDFIRKKIYVLAALKNAQRLWAIWPLIFSRGLMSLNKSTWGFWTGCISLSQPIYITIKRFESWH